MDLTLELLEERIKHERELREQSEAFLSEALEIQAKEYERRLGVLNHAHEQAIAEQARTVSREIYDQYVTTNDEKVSDLSKWRAGIEGRIVGIGVVIGLVVILINIAIRFI